MVSTEGAKPKKKQRTANFEPWERRKMHNLPSPVMVMLLLLTKTQHNEICPPEITAPGNHRFFGWCIASVVCFAILLQVASWSHYLSCDHLMTSSDFLRFRHCTIAGMGTFHHRKRCRDRDSAVPGLTTSPGNDGGGGRRSNVCDTPSHINLHSPSTVWAPVIHIKSLCEIGFEMSQYYCQSKQYGSLTFLTWIKCVVIQRTSSLRLKVPYIMLLTKRKFVKKCFILLSTRLTS